MGGLGNVPMKRTTWPKIADAIPYHQQQSLLHFFSREVNVPLPSNSVHWSCLRWASLGSSWDLIRKKMYKDPRSMTGARSVKEWCFSSSRWFGFLVGAESIEQKIKLCQELREHSTSILLLRRKPAALREEGIGRTTNFSLNREKIGFYVRSF